MDTNSTWVGRPIQSDAVLSTWYAVQLALYRVMCSLLQVICGLGRPIQSDVRSCQGDVRYSYAHKFVMCGDVWWCAVMCGFQALRRIGSIRRQQLLLESFHRSVPIITVILNPTFHKNVRASNKKIMNDSQCSGTGNWCKRVYGV